MIIFPSHIVTISTRDLVTTIFTAVICDGLLGTGIDDKLAGTLSLRRNYAFLQL